MTGVPIRVFTRVDFDDGSSHEYEVRTQDAVAPPSQGTFWPEGVVTRDVRTRMELELARQRAIETGRAEVARLRQILWDVYAATGADTDGDREAPKPGVMTPDVPELALEAVRELRQQHDQCDWDSRGMNE